MANITNLEQFLIDVATAIRTKKETTGQIPAENFDQEILSIDTIKGQEKTIIPSTTEQIIMPDGNYNAITKATIKAVDNTIDSNISPENIKKDVNILGVTGTLEEGEQINNQDKTITENGTYTADEGYTGLGTVTVNVPQKIRMYTSIEAMNNDTEGNDGDIAMVYDMVEVPITNDGTNILANGLLLPMELPLNLTETSIKAYTDIDYSPRGEIQPYYATITFGGNSFKTGMLGSSDGGNVFSVYGLDTSNNKFVRGSGDYNVCKGGIFSLENIYPYYGDYRITRVDITSGLDSEVWNYIKFVKIDNCMFYQLDKSKNKWYVLPTNYHLIENDVALGKKGLGMSGVIVGTFDLTNDFDCTSIPAISHSLFKSLPSTTEVKVPDTTARLNTSHKLTGFGDKRYFYSVWPNDMRGPGNYGITAGYFDDVDTKLTITNNGHIEWKSAKAFEFDGEFTGRMGFGDASPVAVENNLYRFRDTLKTTGLLNTSTEICYYGDTIGWIATNCEIVKADGTTVVEAGPKASDFYIGDYYINIFGEKVEGVKELPSGPISQEEYNTAVATTEDILGNTTE